MKITVHGIIMIIFAAMQATWLNAIEIFSVKPNLFLVYTVVVSCFAGRVEAATVGFAFGLMLDLLSGKIWGLYSLLCMILGFSIASFVDGVGGKRSIVFLLLITFVSSFVLEFIYFLISFTSVGFKHALISVILPEGLYNVVIAIPVYLLIKKLAKFMYADKGEFFG